MIELSKLAGMLSVLLAYSTVLLLFWLSVLGAGKLSLSRRTREHEEAGNLLREAPGRCYLAGLASLVVGGICLGLLQPLKLIGLLMLMAWGRSVFRGLVAWLLLHGRELREGLDEDPGTVSECFRAGVVATAQASSFPVAGWLFLVMALLQGAGSESLRWWRGPASGAVIPAEVAPGAE